MPIVVGKIEPHVFGPGEAGKALRALAVPEVNRATRMANAAQAVWDAVRDSDPEELERIATVAPELGAALAAVRKVMNET